MDERPLPELGLEPGTLIIGDLHLDVSPAAGAGAVEPFADWLARESPPRLVILGDLFDAWIGPAHTSIDGARVVLEALRTLAQRGTAIDVIHGNRDFLLDGSFERASGARVWARGLVGLVGADEERVLLIHGDELCTLDLAYQRLKRVLRSRTVLGAVPLIPTPVALWAARRLRKASVQAIQAKPAAEKEQQAEAVRAEGARHGCGTVICGHAHRFRDERLAAGPRWIVVGAFGGARDVLRVDAGGRIGALDSGLANAVSP
jgi:UDP-2,3-diacylglucosamine hydrolase